MTFEVLAGLPPYGDLTEVEVFTETGQGRHHQGLIVQFEGDGLPSWIGNFQPGTSSFNVVRAHPNGFNYLVVSSGQGYVVDPFDRSMREYFGGEIDNAVLVPEANLLVFGDSTSFEAFSEKGRVWRSRRISWDGIRHVQRLGLLLLGDAWCPMSDSWKTFELNLADGVHSGGSYNGPEDLG